MGNFLFIRLEDHTDFVHDQASWLIMNKTGKIEKISSQLESVLTILNNHPNHEIILIVPDKWVSYYITEVPISDNKKRIQAIPYILEDQIVSNVDTMHFSIGPSLGNNEFIVAAINKNKLINIIYELQETFNLKPRYILTDAICLYDSSNDKDTTKIYLNKTNNIALLVDKTITISDLKNVDIFFAQHKKNIYYEIYKYQLEDVSEYFEHTLNKINIRSENNIDSWLAFLSQSWFKNKLGNRFNLVKGLIKRNLWINFHPLWKYSVSIFILALSLLFGYKYLDQKIYSPRKIELESVIKLELNSVDIKNTRLDLAKKELLRKSIEYKKIISEEKIKNKFLILLANFSNKYTKDMNVNTIKFKDNKLEINLDILDGYLEQMKSIKEEIQKNQIVIEEKIDKESNINKITWILSSHD